MKKLIMILPLTLILCFMVGYQDKEAMAELDQFKAQAALEEQNETIARQILEAYNNRDLDTFYSVFTEDAVRIGASLERHDMKWTREHIKEDLAAVPDAKYTLIRMVTQGNTVVQELVWSGTDNKTNKFMEIPIVIISEFDNGKVKLFIEYYNPELVKQQLGYELKPKEEK